MDFSWGEKMLKKALLIGINIIIIYSNNAVVVYEQYLHLIINLIAWLLVWSNYSSKFCYRNLRPVF